MNTLIFVDAQVPQIETLVRHLPLGALVSRIGTQEDALAHVAARLSNEADIQNLLLIAHGAPGALYLGATPLTLETLDARANALAAIGAAMAPDGLISLYGCEVAAGAEGETFLDRLEELTGRAVAATDSLVGHAGLGGGWTLFRRDLGQTVPMPFMTDLTGEYRAVLAAPTVTSGEGGNFAENGTGTAYTVTATDPENDTLTFAISGGVDAALFNIDSKTGVVTFKNIPDFENPADNGANNTYEIEVTASDGVDTSPSVLRVITVTDVADTALTTGNDTPGLSDGNDVIVAGLANSLNSGDVIDGEGGTDTLVITTAHSLTFNATTLTNVEKVTIGHSTGSVIITTDNGTVASGQTITVDGSAATGTINWDGQAETDGTFNLTGGSANDTMRGGNGADIIHGGAGNDTLYGGSISSDAGNDTLYGGAGNDFLYAHDGDDLLFGEAGNDGLSGGDGNDTIWGGDGNDTTIGGNGDDLHYGGAGNDWMWGQNDNDTLYGGDGNDTISGDAGNDLLFGDAGNDTISGGAADDTIWGGDGDDSLLAGAGIDQLHGGAGNDSFRGSATDHNGDSIADFTIGDSIVVTGTDLTALDGKAASGTIDLGGGNSLTLTGISSASGNFKVVLAGGTSTVTLVAPVATEEPSNPVVVTPTTPTAPGAGDGTQGQNIANTGSTPAAVAIVQDSNNNGNVVTATLPGNTSLTSEGPSLAQTKSDAQTSLVTSIQVRGSSSQSDLSAGVQNYLNTLAPETMLDVRTLVPTIPQGASISTPIVISGTTGTGQSEAFVINMRQMPAGASLQLDNVEFASVLGTASITGGAGQNYVVADEASQYIMLGADDDYIDGGAGDDTVGSADGNDTLLGGAGNDSVFGGAGNDSLDGGDGFDTLDLTGGGANFAQGGLQSDTILGGDGGDQLRGGKGHDSIVGGAGDDVIYAGQGTDTLTGGAGADLFVLKGFDANFSNAVLTPTITDFQQGTDRLAVENATLAELQAAITNQTVTETGVVIQVAGATLTFLGINQLTAADIDSAFYA